MTSPSATAAAVTLNPQILGQAEKAHAAILARALAHTGITQNAWVALSLTVAAGHVLPVEELVGQLTGALKIDQAVARAVIAQLISAELLVGKEIDGEVSVTETGRGLYTEVRGSTGAIVARAYGAVPAGDLAVAGQVLATVTSRLNDELTVA